MSVVVGIDVGGTFTDITSHITAVDTAVLERRGARVAVVTTAGFPR